MTTQKSVRPDEFFVSLVKSTSVATNARFLSVAIPLDDGTILIQAEKPELLHVSRETGEILNRNCIKLGRTHLMFALWDQESVIICNYLGADSTFSQWNFRRNEKSALVKYNTYRMRFMNTLQLGCSDEKFIAVGIDRMEVHLMRVPSFEVIHSFILNR